MKISCIIASVRDDISVMLKSLQDQDFEKNEYEIILVRPESIDVPDTVKLVIESNHGPAAKRNSGFAASTGAYVCFFDDDTHIPHNCLTEMYTYRQLLDDHVIIGGPNIGFADQDTAEELSDIIFKSYIGSGFRKKFRLGSEGYCDSKELSFCNIVMHRDVFVQSGMMNEQFLFSEDYEFFSCAAQKGFTFYYSPKLFVYHKRRRFPLQHIKQIYNWAQYNTISSIDHRTIDRRPDMILLPLSFLYIGLFAWNKTIAIILMTIVSCLLLIIEKFFSSWRHSIIFVFLFPVHVAAYVCGQFSGLMKRTLFRKFIGK